MPGEGPVIGSVSYVPAEEANAFRFTASARGGYYYLRVSNGSSRLSDNRGYSIEVTAKDVSPHFLRRAIAGLQILTGIKVEEWCNDDECPVLDADGDGKTSIVDVLKYLRAI